VPCRSTARMAGREGRKEAEASCEWYGNRRAAPLAEPVSADGAGLWASSPTPSVSPSAAYRFFLSDCLTGPGPLRAFLVALAFLPPPCT
jgi:hypothetical protein